MRGAGEGRDPLADGWPPGPGLPCRPRPSPPADKRHRQGTKGPHPLPPPPSDTDPRAGGGAAPPPPPPHPPQLGSHRRGPPPPQGRGGAPPLRRNGDAVRATAAGPAPANPHRRAGATRTTEQEGGRAPHDPPVTTAHSEVTERGFQVSWGPRGSGPRAAPQPPPTPGRHFSPDRTHAPEGSAPATRREPERSTAGRRPEREQGGRGATPPAPPPPHQPASRGGPGPHPPRQGGCPPPAREGSRSVTRPPAPAAGSHGGREEEAGPRLRTGTPHRSYPEKPGEHEPEWYGGPRPPWTAQRQ